MPKITKAGPTNRHEADDPTSDNYVDLEAPVEPVAEEHADVEEDVVEPEQEEVLEDEEVEAETPVTGPAAADVRAWARENGVDINDRGAISASVLEQYAAAHQEM